MAGDVTLNRAVAAGTVTVTVIATNSAKGVELDRNSVVIASGTTGDVSLSIPTNDADATDDVITITASGTAAPVGTPPSVPVVFPPDHVLTLNVQDNDKLRTSLLRSVLRIERREWYTGSDGGCVITTPLLLKHL